MAKQGRIVLSKAGFTMPVDAPAYQRPPFYYRGVRQIAVAFETDADTVLDALPAPLAINDPATVVVSFYEYPWTTFGPYNEAILSIPVEHRGRPMVYIQHICVTTEPPMLGGREIWGFPKKLAAIEFRSERDMFYGTIERPAGTQLATAIVRPERPGNPELAKFPPVASLRFIPSADEHAERPTCAEIVETVVDQQFTEVWEGTGSVSFPQQSAFDPWGRYPIKRIVGASYNVYDMTLPFGRVIDRL
jgi:acetoacetate decarboxylase